MKHCNESGMALITTLALMALVGVLVASAVALSQYTSAEIATFTSLTVSRYQAEGAANRLLYRLLQESNLRSGRLLGEKANPSRNPKPTEELTADGSPLQWDCYGKELTVWLYDAVCGYALTGSQPLNLPVHDALKIDKSEFDRWRNILLDYIDRDDFVRDGGMEAVHYRQRKLPVLPRNAPLRYREEVFWLPGAARWFAADEHGVLTVFRPVAPAGLAELNGRPNLFSAPLPVIQRLAGLNDEEIKQVKRALEGWRGQKKPLTESLPPGMISRLGMALNRQESGVYTILVDASEPELPGSRLWLTVRPRLEENELHYYEFLWL
ncbi:hypothetical protein [Victivallis sp. Marseille-Q1083]|uniref:hypothetical protein n=1 Tax=Victivallis sp. Marseille-Q1083 TaxID=2717288 RepID=UPI00158F08E1|nr:hypothetical protein [Victivallis sp. Marseille-Q1083]